MKVVCLSDTHNLQLRKGEYLRVPRGDILVHCGDATMNGDPEQVELFAQWWNRQPHRYQVLVPGNHDWGFEKPEVRAAFEKRCPRTNVLVDSEVSIEGLRIWGSPWQPEFMGWAFNLPRGKALKAHWDLIPEGLDVLVTHSPPMGKLDLVGRQHVGCADLAAAVASKAPSYHVFGHIHEGYGIKKIGATVYVNCAMADGSYHLTQPAVVLDL